ncbi:predicted protein [Sclerotinia sclerotiorum 1980 UF-70]|uniref:Uncharacterized protein n=2 Tax=Sclerotinia sclerotiorum (strain ATCC 18683 / 1980 / Ss-1) TaxID=665079 RepID=A7EWB0_SCLS1|nr:predicted protein [Sclerotinia sclerotiorum 1980 UF-70]APA05239.1 hypothetical protein sscle_01g000090 [Sclerotinia sclerotiorum 1980 UF-70]EDN93752.1 predicted protein [Sclerotinia sclerotiorum 1980 UF-70]
MGSISTLPTSIKEINLSKFSSVQNALKSKHHRVKQSIKIGKPTVHVAVNYRLGTFGYIGSEELRKELENVHGGSYDARAGLGELAMVDGEFFYEDWGARFSFKRNGGKYEGRNEKVDERLKAYNLLPDTLHKTLSEIEQT